MRDARTLADLLTFAHLEVAAADIEPWAATLAAMTREDCPRPLGFEQAMWAVHLYNSTDDMRSAFRIMTYVSSPEMWAKRGPTGRRIAAGVPLSGERRNLYGGRILHRLDSYIAQLGGESQRSWISEVVRPDRSAQANFLALMPYLRRVWGVGRLAAFEWAEFIHKVGRLPVETTDGCLWESSGPRESLERLYNGGEPAPSLSWLSDRAAECKAMLTDGGVPLSWWDFETVICDFNVMRKGRYYPGKHLAMLSAEIMEAPEVWKAPLTAAYRSVVPAGWRDLPPGTDAELARAYVRTGRVANPLEYA